MNTSKIELTDKLRRLGLWEEASRFKDECKRRLIDAGASRRDAGEEAWTQMEEQFTGENLKRYQAIQAKVMANYPPLIDPKVANAEGEANFDLVWLLWCMSLARLECWEGEDFVFAARIATEIAQVDSGIENRPMLDTAVSEVSRFVGEYATTKFEDVVERLESIGDPEANLYASELRAHLHEMCRFGPQGSVAE